MTTASLAVSPVGNAIYTSPTTDITVELTQDGRFSISEDTSTDLSIVLLAPTSASVDVDGGLLGFEHNDGSSTVPVVKDDGSVQVTSVIESPSAPLDYSYEVTAGPGSSLELLEDGSVFIRDGAGEYAGAIAAPWAKDSVGAAVPTRYEVSGDVLTQIVEHNAADVIYPVVADPYAGKALITSVKLVQRSDGATWAVTKTAWGQSVASGDYGAGSEDALGGQTIMRNQGWSEARSKGLPNTTTIRQQYDCHTVFAAAKNPWNLEPWRGTNGWWAVQPWTACNW